jgi:SPP1 gp7 family putative phage head morphogenesis protein
VKEPEKVLGRPVTEEIASIKRDVEYLVSTFAILPNPDPILKKLGRDISEYENVKSDAHVFSVLTSRKAGIVSCPWRVAPASDSRADRKVAEFVREVLGNLNFYNDLKQMLSAIWFGYSVSEVIWAERDGRWMIADLKGRHQRRFRFDADGNPRLLTASNPIEGEALPPMKFLIVRHDPESDDNPYGEPVAARCYWPWFFKKHGWKFWAIFAEKYGMPHVWGKHPPGTSEEEKQKLLEALMSLVQDGATVTADNQAIELLDDQTRASSTDAYRTLVEACNAEISKAVLGQTLTTEIGPTGSYAAARTHMEVRADIVESDAQMLMSAISDQIIRWLVGLNFGWDADLPTFNIDYEEEDYKRDKAERDKILWEMGYRFPLKYFSETYGVPLPQEGEEVVEKPPGVAFSERNLLSERQRLLSEMFSAALSEALRIYRRIRTSIENEIRGWSSVESMDTLLSAVDEEATDDLANLLLNTTMTTYLWGKKGLYDQLGARFAETVARPMKPKEALEYFRELIPIVAEEYYELEEELRHKFFTVSRAESERIVERVHRSLLRAIEEGKTIADFLEEMDEVFGAAGITPANPYHLETVFRTNIQTAYYAGYWEALGDPGMKQEFSWAQYITAGDERVRPAHAAMDGYTAPVNDPIWQKWTPPCGFNCRCDLVFIHKSEARDLVRKPPPPVEPDPGFGIHPSEALRTTDLEVKKFSLGGWFARVWRKLLDKWGVAHSFICI